MSSTKDFIIENGVLKRYTGPGGEVTVPPGVTRVGERAFADCAGLTGITLPEGVTTLESCAFMGCTGLVWAAIPKSTVKIGITAFYQCTALAEIRLDPANSAYRLVDGLLLSKNGKRLELCPRAKRGRVIIPEGVTEIRSGAFDGCVGITSIRMPASAPIVQNRRALECCVGLTEFQTAEGDQVYSTVNGILADRDGRTLLFCPRGRAGALTIPEGPVKAIKAFQNCARLTSITFPASITAIGSTRGCTSLAEIRVDPANPVYRSADGLLLSRDGSRLIRCPEGRTGTVAVPEGVAEIGDKAFLDCAGLTGITLPEGVVRIGDRAFSGCTGLTGIVIPASAAQIGESAFAGCFRLAEIRVGPAGPGLCPAYRSVDGMLLSGDGKRLKFCPKAKSGTAVIPEGVTMIGDHAFWGCSGLTSVTLPKSLTAIEMCAFQACTGLTGIVIPAGVCRIGEDAFAECTALARVTLPAGLEDIAPDAFAGCDQLAEFIETAGDRPAPSNT